MRRDRDAIVEHEELDTELDALMDRGADARIPVEAEVADLLKVQERLEAREDTEIILEAAVPAEEDAAGVGEDGVGGDDARVGIGRERVRVEVIVGEVITDLTPEPALLLFILVEDAEITGLNLEPRVETGEGIPAMLEADEDGVALAEIIFIARLAVEVLRGGLDGLDVRALDL